MTKSLKYMELFSDDKIINIIHQDRYYHPEMVAKAKSIAKIRQLRIIPIISSSKSHTTTYESSGAYIIGCGFVFIFLLGIFLMPLFYGNFYCFQNWKKNQKLQKSGLVVKGIVLDKRKTKVKAGYNYALNYSFEVKRENNKKVYTKYKGVNSEIYYAFDKKELIPIIYVDSNPDISDIMGNTHQRNTFYLFLILDFLILSPFIVGLFLLIIPSSKKLIRLSSFILGVMFIIVMVLGLIRWLLYLIQHFYNTTWNVKTVFLLMAILIFIGFIILDIYNQKSKWSKFISSFKQNMFNPKMKNGVGES